MDDGDQCSKRAQSHGTRNDAGTRSEDRSQRRSSRGCLLQDSCKALCQRKRFSESPALDRSLQQMEPDTLRTRVLHGAACVRCGHMEKAIEILKDRPEDSKRPKTRRDRTYHLERRSMLLVALVQSGARHQVYGPVLGQQMQMEMASYPPASAAEEPDAPSFILQEGYELVPDSTKLFYIPSIWFTSLQSPPRRLGSFVRTLILPWL